MDIIPVLDIYKKKVVTAVEGNRHSYKPIASKLYDSTDPKEIISTIKKRYKPSIIYIADLDAIIDKKVNSKIINDILTHFPEIDFWIDTGLNILELKKRYINYHPVFCTEKSVGFDIYTNNKKKYICSFDYKKRILGNVNLPKLLKYLPKKIILMDLEQVGSSKYLNFKMLRKYFRRSNRYDFYIAGGVKTTLDLYRAKSLGAKGVLVSSILKKDCLPRLLIQKRKNQPIH